MQVLWQELYLCHVNPHAHLVARWMERLVHQGSWTGQCVVYRMHLRFFRMLLD